MKLTPAAIILIVAAILTAIGLITAPIIGALPADVRTNNVLITGVPFILMFVALVLAFVVFIHSVAVRLNGKISARSHGIIEAILIGGVVFGLLGMFQPWAIGGYQIGFHVLLVCFLAFNVWSHVSPKAAQRMESVDRTVIQ